MESGKDVLDNPEEEINIENRIKQLRESMEIESNVFLKATKEFVFEWTLKEMEMSVSSSNMENTEGTSDSLRKDKHKPEELKTAPKEFSERISELVESQLNIDDYWLHRNPFLQTGLSQDYLEFKKEKMRKQLNSSIRIILGCCVEAIGRLKKEELKNTGWVEEKGKIKYVCFLRFSDEMITCLNRYFEGLEQLFVLYYELEEITEEKLHG